MAAEEDLIAMATTRNNPTAPASKKSISLRWLVSNGMELLFNWVFSVTRMGGRIRFLFFVVGGLALWIMYTAHIQGLQFWPQVGQSIRDIITSLIQPDPLMALKNGVIEFVLLIFGGLANHVVIRHIIVVALPLFVAARIAITYLTDIFELENERIAARFISQASFGLRFHRISVENAKAVPEESSILRIGGPGLVKVNLENVAVFERINGSPELIGPTVTQSYNAALLQSYERFREAIDLRDQITQRDDLEVTGRTRDGIRITAKNIRVIFSVLRNKQVVKDGAMVNNLSYDELAIKRLVYNRPLGPWPIMMENLVYRHLKDFVASHNLSEFLAAADVPEFRQTIPEAGVNQTDTHNATARSVTYKVSTGTQSFTFISRPAITWRFLTPEFINEAESLGTQLHWINVGTWVTSASVISDRQVDAWKITADNQVRRRKFEQQEKENRVDELVSMIRGVPLIAFRNARGANKSDYEIQHELLSNYQGILRTALSSYANEHLTPPIELPGAVQFISDMLNREQHA